MQALACFGKLVGQRRCDAASLSRLRAARSAAQPFATPSGKIELYAQNMARNGHDPAGHPHGCIKSQRQGARGYSPRRYDARQAHVTEDPGHQPDSESEQGESGDNLQGLRSAGRLCLARSLALQPEVILLDEPTSGLDPISTGKVEASLQELKQEYTIVLVPHSIQQAARVADYAAFFLQGELVEYAPGKELFTNPHDKRTEDYIEGRFG